MGQPDRERPVSVRVLWAQGEGPLKSLALLPVGGVDPQRGSFRIDGLRNGQLYQFAIEFVGVHGNRGDLSNTVGMIPAPVETIETVSVAIPTGSLSWSPDGQVLAISSIGFGFPVNQYKLLLHVLNTGSTRHVAFKDATDLDALFPSWSPDGNRIAFNAEVGGDVNHIFVVDPETGEVEQITGEDMNNWGAAWSPQGDRIAFVTGNAVDGYRIATIPSDGGDISLLTTGPGDEVRPAWSHDGTHLFFQSRLPAEDGTSQGAILTVPARGGPATELIGPVWKADLATPSPDGHWLAYHSARSGHSEVWLYDLLYGSIHQLTGTSISSAFPLAWSPDSRVLAVSHRKIPDSLDRAVALVVVAEALSSQSAPVSQRASAETEPREESSDRSSARLP